MFKLKSFVLSGLFLCLFSSAMFAEDNSPSLEKSQELITLVKMDQMLDQQIEVAVQQLIIQVPEFSNHKEEINVIFEDMLNKKEFTQFVTKLLADNFTESEIQEMIKFYQSPTGQKALSKMPLITQETMIYMQQKMSKNKDKLEALFKKIDAEQKQKNQPQTPTKK